MSPDHGLLVTAEGYQGIGGDVRGDLITCSIEHPHPSTGLPVPTVCTSVQQPHPQLSVMYELSDVQFPGL